MNHYNLFKHRFKRFFRELTLFYSLMFCCIGYADISLPGFDKDIQTILSNPNSVIHIYNKYRASLKAQLGPAYVTLNNDGLKMIMTTIIAYRLKPYGNSTARHLQQFLQDKSANCATYPVAAYELFKILSPQSAIKVSFVGWNGGAVGNHAQMFVESGAVLPLLLDPTIGLIVISDLNWVMSGKQIDSIHVASAFIDKPNETADIKRFNAMVKNALYLGQYKPYDFLYYFGSYVDFQTGAGHWATPQYYKLSHSSKTHKITDIYQIFLDVKN